MNLDNAARARIPTAPGTDGGTVIIEQLVEGGHEQLVACVDSRTSLRALIAIHSTVLGPALGGARFFPYPNEQEALNDVLRLSRAMTYKAAAANLNLGGGKAVIIGNPREHKSHDLLRAFGRFVDSLGGRYVTAEDVGTTVSDMDVIRKETRRVTGCSRAIGGSGDPSKATAYGVLQGIKACLHHLTDDSSVSGKRIAVQGVGKVGLELSRYLVAEGAFVIVADEDSSRTELAVSELRVPAVSPHEIFEVDADVFSPNALGGCLNQQTIQRLRVPIIAGAANNQLQDDSIADEMALLGMLYAPDFIINAGGIINIEQELRGYDPALAKGRIESIFQTVQTILKTASEKNQSTLAAALDFARTRLE